MPINLAQAPISLYAAQQAHLSESGRITDVDCSMSQVATLTSPACTSELSSGTRCIEEWQMDANETCNLYSFQNTRIVLNTPSNTQVMMWRYLPDANGDCTQQSRKETLAPDSYFSGTVLPVNEEQCGFMF